MFVLNYKLMYDEENYHKLQYKLRSLRLYNMLAYKYLIFKCYRSMKKGVFIGEKIYENKNLNLKSFSLVLPTDNLFKKVYGEIKVLYIVDDNSHLIIVKDILPDDILSEGHKMYLESKDGVVISNNNSQKTLFKINLIKELEKHQ